jgi:ParB-like nuclease family protein
LAGESGDHARTLAELEADLPPILVHRRTMRVIDGMHRIRAAILRGHDEVLVEFYDGDDDDAFILAVKANVTHGLPLSTTDRTAAAGRILAIRPQWSDRKIAAVSGLAASTVGAIRRRSTDASAQSNATTRVGRDGKVRPLNAASGRLLASELIKRSPDGPIREIAAAAGVSPSTALDVRTRLRRGDDPVPAGRRSAPARPAGVAKPIAAGAERPAANPPMADRESVLQNLRRDPSLCFNDAGRALLRWLDSHSAGLEQWMNHLDTVPPHCSSAIAELARLNGQAWQELAEHLDGGRGTGRP